MKLVPRVMTFTAGSDERVLVRVWVMPEPHLADLLNRARAGESTDDLLIELVLADAALGSEPPDAR